MKGLADFKALTMGMDLPPNVVTEIEKMNGFKYPGNWFYDLSFIKGDDFIVTTNDGGFYKVHAQYMIWYKIGERTGSQAIWTMAALKRSLKSLMVEHQTTFDPNYQT